MVTSTVASGHIPSSLSATRLTCYQRCPALYFQRYVLSQSIPANVPMSFGQAVHSALEQAYLGGDPVQAFLRSWRAEQDRLRLASVTIPGQLTRVGLDLVEAALRLKISGEPERKFLFHWEGIPTPFTGIIDLWCSDRQRVIDWKTTAGRWTQKRADAEAWQPVLYSMAYWMETHQEPTFTYVVLDRVTGSIQVFDTVRSGEQLVAAGREAQRILQAIEAQEFGCLCGGAQCAQAQVA